MGEIHAFFSKICQVRNLPGGGQPILVNTKLSLFLSHYKSEKGCAWGGPVADALRGRATGLFVRDCPVVGGGRIIPVDLEREASDIR